MELYAFNCSEKLQTVNIRRGIWGHRALSLGSMKTQWIWNKVCVWWWWWWGGRAQILLSENLSSQIGIFSISTHLALVFIDVIEMISLI